MQMSDTLRRLTTDGVDAVRLLDAARDGGMRFMHDDARDKIALGLTDQAEMMRVLA